MKKESVFLTIINIHLYGLIWSCDRVDFSLSMAEDVLDKNRNLLMEKSDSHCVTNLVNQSINIILQMNHFIL